MPQEVNAVVQTFLKVTVYLGVSSDDATTTLIRRLNELSGDMTARWKAVIAAAGTSN